MGWDGCHPSAILPTGQRNANALTDSEWAVIEPFLPGAKPTGRPRTTELRSVVDALLYIAWTGCPVAGVAGSLPAGFDGSTLFLCLAGQWAVEDHQLPSGGRGTPDPWSRGEPERQRHRQPIGKGHGCAGLRGYEAGRKIKGRKRHIITDTEGAPGRADGAYGRHPGQGWGSRRHRLHSTALPVIAPSVRRRRHPEKN
ncbi:transposase [Mesorhizobium metallidurans STM 2683]|uniref:Transposase n=1 Tax=Mesorhizobium metallidurans STM 2683 TaxID=1297569 RepID=M5FAW0_9HYPH|nr:transposase [Mesorhizobium metallidurans STM 2683]